MVKNYYRVLFIVVVLIFVSVRGFSQSRGIYYWDGNVKREIIIDSTEVIADVSSMELADFNKRGFNLKPSTKDQYHRVKLDRLSATDRTKLKGRHGYLFSSRRNPNEQSFITDEISIKLKSPSSRSYLENKYGLRYSRSNKYNEYVFVVKDWSTTLNIANKIFENEKSPVEWCLPNFLSKITTFADPPYSLQYYLNNTGQTGGVSNIDINAPEAWQISKGCAIRVAVIDEGIDAHVKFGSRLVSGFTAGTFPGTGQPMNEIPGVTTKSHGVHCAGIIGASHDTDLSMKGIAPGVTLIPVNIFPNTIDNGVVTEDKIADAIDWAWSPTGGNADVISNSWGGGLSHAGITAAIGRARTQGRGGVKGSVVVFAAGNGGSSVSFPGNVSGVITVGAINKSGSLWAYSNTGPELDLVAPSGDLALAGDVVTTDRALGAGDNTASDGNYITSFGGTSAATPQVAGVAALMLSLNPNLTETQVRTILQATARDLGTVGFDNSFGYGLVNAEAALLKVSADMMPITGADPVCYSSSSTGGTTFSVTNVPAGSTITWTRSSNLTEVSGQGTINYKVKATSSTAAETGWVSAKVVNGCKGYVIKRDIWVGKPAALKIVGPANVAANQNNDYEMQRATSSLPSFETQRVTNYTWSVPASSGWNCYDCTGSFIVMMSGTNSVIMTGNAINACAATSKTYHVVVTASGGCPGGMCKQAFVVSPNPSSDEILVSKESTSSEAITNITLMDSNGGILYSVIPEESTHTKIPIRDYKNGDYFISITQGGVTQTNKLVIKH